MRHFKFYLQHAWRDMTRNGARTVFALFCVAAGVAAIVALRSLALMIGDSLNVNLGGANHGDIKVEPLLDVGNLGGNMPVNGVDSGREGLPENVVGQIAAWAKDNNVQMTSIVNNANIQVAPLDNAQNVGRPQLTSSFIIDPAVYPFYGPVKAIDPPGVELSKLFTGGNDVVISQNFAEANHIKVGDKVRVGRTTELFTVRGIVPTDVEGNLQQIFAAFFGFVYFDKAQSTLLQINNQPSQVFLKAPDGANVQALATSLKAQVPTIRVTTTEDLRNENSEISDAIDRLILIMGLAALLIGGTGIIHTMLVVVSRRTVEVAVLKTVGVQGRQVTLMFLTESVIMGILGSLIGLVLGVIFSIAVRSFTQEVWPQALGWKIYPAALLTGLLLGVIITAVFGFLPTLIASAIRPALVLRPNEVHLPAAGLFQIALTIIVVIGAIGLIAGTVIGNLLIGIGAVLFAAIIMLGIVLILWLVIALVGGLPAFGSVDLRLALRGLGDHKTRTASTLLSLIVGIFSLSVITLAADSVPRLLNVQLTNALGGNVMAFALVPALQRPFIIAQLKNRPGVEEWHQIGSYSGQMVALNGDRDYARNIKLAMPGFVLGQVGMSTEAFVKTTLGSVGAVDVAAPGFIPKKVIEGRPLGPEDAGKRNVLMQSFEGTPMFEGLSIKPGDNVTFKFGSTEVTFTVVGLTPNNKSSGSLTINPLDNIGTFSAPVDSFPLGLSPTFEFTIARVQDAYLNQTLVNLASIPGVIPFDVSFFETLIKRLLSEFTAIPTIVAVLSLFAGAVVIANTVSLSTLERRRQIGVMKAVGLKGWRVLFLMILENGLIGLLGGLLGVGIGVIATLILSIGSSLNIGQSVSWGIVAVLLALSIVISLVATLFSAWTATTEKPLNVLRYE